MAAPASFLAIETVGTGLLEKALRKYQVNEELVEFITQPPLRVQEKQDDNLVWVVKRDGLELNTLEDYANLDDPDKIQPILSGIRDKVDATKGNLGQLSRLRTCWNDIRKQLEAADVVAVKAPEPAEEEDVDRPLDRPTQRKLMSDWTATYSEALWHEGQHTPCDSLVGRVHREFEAQAMTLLLISKVRTVLMDKKPKERKTVPISGSGVTLTVDAEDQTVALSSVYEYFMGLTVLMNAWSHVGTRLVESKLEPGD